LNKDVSAAFLPPLHELLSLFPSRTFVGTFFYVVCVNFCMESSWLSSFLQVSEFRRFALESSSSIAAADFLFANRVCHRVEAATGPCAQRG